MNHKLELVKLLGIDENSSDEVISNSITTFQREMVDYKNAIDEENAALKNRAESAEREADALKNRVGEITGKLVDSDIEEFKDVISNTEVVREQLLADREGTLKFLGGLKLGNRGAATREPIHNSKKAGQPAPSTVATENPVDDATAAKISNRAREIQKTENISHMQAFRRAQSEFAKQ